MTCGTETGICFGPLLEVTTVFIDGLGKGTAGTNRPAFGPVGIFLAPVSFVLPSKLVVTAIVVGGAKAAEISGLDPTGGGGAILGSSRGATEFPSFGSLTVAVGFGDVDLGGGVDSLFNTDPVVLGTFTEELWIWVRCC